MKHYWNLFEDLSEEITEHTARWAIPYGSCVHEGQGRAGPVLSAAATDTCG